MHSLAEELRLQGGSVPTCTLVDVGVSGGIDPRWRAWGDALDGLGLDVLVGEVERLRAEEPGRLHYIAAKIGRDTVVPPPDSPSDYALHRSQAFLATVLLGEATDDAFLPAWQKVMDLAPEQRPREANYSNVTDSSADPFLQYYTRRFAGSDDVRVTDRAATLDEVIAEAGLDGKVDVVKIDTDGHDLDVIESGRRTLAAGVLAVEVEVQFTGLRNPQSNIFCNIDSALRELGFTLANLTPVRYSRSALPSPFLYDIPAQTRAGAVVWADAVYLRDLLADRTPSEAEAAGARDAARCLALIADRYGLHDWAAELILAFPHLFSGCSDNGLLDHLAASAHGEGTTYARLTEQFARDPLGIGRQRAEHDH